MGTTATGKSGRGTIRAANHSRGRLAMERGHWPYFVAWVGIFLWLYTCFLPSGTLLFFAPQQLTGLEQPITYIWLVVCSLVAVLWDGTRYVPKTVYSVLAAMGAFVGTLVFRETGAATVCYVLSGIAVGHIFASCGYGFFMILNNSEKFYAMLLGIALPKLLLWALSIPAAQCLPLTPQQCLYALCLLTLLPCAVCFRMQRETIPPSAREPIPKMAYSLMPVVFMALALNDVLAPFAILQLSARLSLHLTSHYLLGIFSALCLLCLVQRRYHAGICAMLNGSFVLLSAGFVMVLAAQEYPLLAKLAAVLFGVSYAVGMVNIYYLAGIMAKKLRSVSFYRMGIVLSALYYFCGYGLLALLGSRTLLVSICAIASLLVFFLLSPILEKLLSSGEWIDDSYRPDVTFGTRLDEKLKEYRLSPKEAAVCRLLLEGYTLRQTAAMLGIAYPTANTYQTALYRKLSINSKAELLLLLRDFQ